MIKKLKLKLKYIFAPQSTTINIQRKYIRKKKKSLYK